MIFDELTTAERITPSKYGSDLTDSLKGQGWGRRLYNTALGLNEYIDATATALDVEFSAEDKRAILISCMIWGDRNGLTSIIIDDHPIYQRLAELAKHFYQSSEEAVAEWRKLWIAHKEVDPDWQEIIDISPNNALAIIAGLEHKLENES